MKYLWKNLAVMGVVGGVFTLGSFFANASPSSCGSTANRLSTQNPAHPVNTAIEVSIQRSIAGMERASAVHAAEEESEAFRYPSVFAEYGYSKIKDTRGTNVKTLTDSFTLGMDFMTLGDFFVGGMVSYGDFKVRDTGTLEDSGDTWTFTLYGAKALGENLFAGTSLSYSRDDSNRGGKTDTYGIAPYVSYVIRIENISLSITPTYSLSFTETETDESNRGVFLLATRATLEAAEGVSLFAGATLNQVLHSHLLDAENGQDHSWVETSIGVDWRLNDMVGVNASLGYDAFNKHYRDNFNTRVGVTFSF